VSYVFRFKDELTVLNVAKNLYYLPSGWSAGLGSIPKSYILAATQRKYFCQVIVANKDLNITLQKLEFKNLCRYDINEQSLGKNNIYGYREILVNSVFVIIANLYNMNKFWDAIEAGAIPILINSKFIINLPKSHPFDTYKFWSEALNSIKELSNNSPELLKKQSAIMYWWQEYANQAKQNFSAVIEESFYKKTYVEV